MPWGRWITERIQEVSDDIIRVDSDSNSEGSMHKAWASNMAQNIETFASRDAALLSAPDLVGTVGGADGFRTISMTASFSLSPRASEDCELFINYTMQNSPTIGSLPIAGWVIIAVNGVDVASTIFSDYGWAVSVKPGPMPTIRIPVHIRSKLMPGQVNTVTLSCGGFIASPFVSALAASLTNITIGVVSNQRRSQ